MVTLTKPKLGRPVSEEMEAFADAVLAMEMNDVLIWMCDGEHTSENMNLALRRRVCQRTTACLRTVIGRDRLWVVRIR